MSKANTAQHPVHWSKAVRHLKKDPVMAQIIARYKGEVMISKGDPFETLLRSIVGQQISVKAADSVWRKLQLVHPKCSPELFLQIPVTELRKAGLSERKALYARDLALHFYEKRLTPKGWLEMSDEEVISQLTQVKGVGRWTAEMFLMFHLLRPNILPVADLGLQKAISIHYGRRYPISPRVLQKVAKSWHPYCTVATWYLWRSLDPIPVSY